MGLVRGIHASKPRQAIVRGIASIATELDILLIAEGIEEIDEALCLRDLGINLMQGYLFSKPLFESCVQPHQVHWPV